MGGKENRKKRRRRDTKVSRLSGRGGVCFNDIEKGEQRKIILRFVAALLTER
jgi:hypothetical protein